MTADQRSYTVSPLALSGVVRDAYCQVVRPHLRFTTTCYFASRWVPVLGLYPAGLNENPRKSAGKSAGSAAWLIVALRQFAIWNRSDTTQISQKTLSKWIGSTTRTLQTLLGEPLVQWFMQEQPGPYVTDSSGQTRRAATRYTVRLDDPIVPADIESLAACYQRMSSVYQTDSVLDRVKQFLDWALTQPVDLILAPSPTAPLSHPQWFEAGPITIAQMIAILEPEISALDTGNLEPLYQALTLKITGPESVIGSNLYFRQNWVPRLGPGPAWIYMYLRALVYMDDSCGAVRDTCDLIGVKTLADRLGVRSESILEWLQILITNGFLEILDSRKLTDSQIWRQIRVSTAIPLTQSGYDEWTRIINQIKPDSNLPADSDWVPGDFSPTDEGVPGDFSPTDEGVPGDFSPTDEGVPGDFSPTDEGVPGDFSPIKCSRLQRHPDSHMPLQQHRRRQKSADVAALPRGLMSALDEWAWSGSTSEIQTAYNQAPEGVMTLIPVVNRSSAANRAGLFLSMIRNGVHLRQQAQKQSADDPLKFISGPYGQFVEH
jgi:hypothetical protein